MTNYILFDDDSWDRLLPLTFTRPVCELRVGLFTLRERWEKRLHTEVSYITQEYLSDKYPLEIEEDNIIINGSLLANDYVVKLVQELDINEALMYHKELMAARLPREQFVKLINDEEIDELQGTEMIDTPVIKFDHRHHLFQSNSLAIGEDISWLESQNLMKNNKLPNSCRILGHYPIFVGDNCDLEHVVFNTKDGPIYIGDNVTIMDGSVVRGPAALLSSCTLKMGSKIYGGTTIGPHCKIGGEVNNVIFHGYSNKAHDGFIGNSVVGSWCNIGADSNSSNLKNNYGLIKTWSYESKSYEDTEAQFCGLSMGDHSTCGINTMFNTGTTVGVGVNIFGGGFPPKYVPSFSWGGITKPVINKLDKLFESANRMMLRRGKSLSEGDTDILKHIFEKTQENRDSLSIK